MGVLGISIFRTSQSVQAITVNKFLEFLPTQHDSNVET